MCWGAIPNHASMACCLHLVRDAIAFGFNKMHSGQMLIHCLNAPFCATLDLSHLLSFTLPNVSLFHQFSNLFSSMFHRETERMSERELREELRGASAYDYYTQRKLRSLNRAGLMMGWQREWGNK